VGLQTAQFQDKEERSSTVNLDEFKVANVVSGNPTDAPIVTDSSKIPMYSEAGMGEKRRKQKEIEDLRFLPFLELLNKLN